MYLYCTTQWYVIFFSSTGTGASSNPCSQTYHGPSVHSESEVKAIVDFVKSHGNLKTFLSIHSYSQMLLYPYGHTRTSAKDQAELVCMWKHVDLDTVNMIDLFKYNNSLSLQHELARKAVSELQSLHNTAYTYGSVITTICKYIYN